MREAYLGPDKLDVVTMSLGTSRGFLLRIARRENWPPRSKRGPRRRWQGATLARLESDWRAGICRRVLAEEMGTSESRIYQLAREHGWPARRPGRRSGVPV
ncbi:MAG: hypothetical protein ACK4JB_20025 [Reyranella sp.]